MQENAYPSRSDKDVHKKDLRVGASELDMSNCFKSHQKLTEAFSLGYTAEINLIPTHLGSYDLVRQRFDDRSISVPNSRGSIWCQVIDPKLEKLVATAVFAADESYGRCDTVDVTLNYRRQHVATNIYLLASRIFRLPIVPSTQLSEDARKFWGTKAQITYI